MDIPKNVKKGMNVEIVTKQNKMARGIVEDVAPRPSLSGVIVRLLTGEIGKVQKIIGPESTKVDVDFERLLKKGENFYCEFKESALWSQNFTEEDVKKSRSAEVHYYKKKASRIIIAKVISGFLNSDGGNLIIGIRENKNSKQEVEIVGIQEEFGKLSDKTKDGYKRMIIDEIIKPYFPSKIIDNLNKYLQIEFISVQEKLLCWIRINKSESRVFLNLEGKEIFMIRIESENRELNGEKLVDYCIRRF
ncbi:MAG: helix-turn-helix domain-containing protein [Candidatus Nanoarchaeia archaeon]